MYVFVMFRCFLCLSLVIFFISTNMAYAENTTKKTVKIQNKIEKLKKRKTKTTKKLNFLKHRLEVQEQKLEVYTSEDNNKKGEKE